MADFPTKASEPRIKNVLQPVKNWEFWIGLGRILTLPRNQADYFAYMPDK